jgi:hypothetical protein
MKYEKRLNAGERWDITAVGQYLGYVSGVGEIEVSVDGVVHYLNVNEVYEFQRGFTSFTVRNMSDVTGDFVIKAAVGRFHISGDGQKIEVQNSSDISTPIVEEIDALSGKTLKTSVQNTSDISTPIVSKIADLIGSVINIRAITEALNIRTITETLKAQIVDLVETREKPATRISAYQETLLAGEPFTVLANAARRDITILCDSDNEGVVFVESMPLAAGEKIEFKKYIGAVSIEAAANNKIKIVEVIYG